MWLSDGERIRRTSVDDEYIKDSVVILETPCWTWNRAARLGYGVFGLWIDGKPITKLAHRESYRYYKGEIPQGYEIDHLCKNTRCVNPDHLEAVTPQENLKRSNAPSSIQARSSHCMRGHEFTPENTYVRKDRHGGRLCKICRRETIRRRNARKRIMLGQ